MKKLNGVAVVSAIMSAGKPETAARELRGLIDQSPVFITRVSQVELRVEQMLACVNDVIEQLAQKQPLCHNMTNLVVQNFAANVALAM